MADVNRDEPLHAPTQFPALQPDKINGSRAERPGATKALEHMRKGDTQVSWKLDRVGRSEKRLVNLVTELHKRGVHFHRLTDAIDAGTPSRRFFFLRWQAGLKWSASQPLSEHAGLEVARKLGRGGSRKRLAVKSSRA